MRDLMIAFYSSKANCKSNIALVDLYCIIEYAQAYFCKSIKILM